MSRSRLDPNQIIQHAFDETTGSLKTVPSSATTFSIELDATDGDSVESRSMATETTHLNAVSGGTSINSTDQNVLNYRKLMVSISWTGFNQTDGTLKVQYSLDGTVYHDMNTTNLSAASGTDKYVDDCGAKFMRVSFTRGTNTTGTITVKSVVKG